MGFVVGYCGVCWFWVLGLWLSGVFVGVEYLIAGSLLKLFEWFWVLFLCLGLRCCLFVCCLSKLFCLNLVLLV